MVGVCLGLPLTPWACRPVHGSMTQFVGLCNDRTFGEFNVVVVCTFLDVIAPHLYM